MGQKAGVFFHNGLGDGVNGLVLSNNLHLNGWQVDTYQNTMWTMQDWFPHLPIYFYPPLDHLQNILNAYDWFFVVNNDTDPFILKLVEVGKVKFPEKMKVIYLYPSSRIVNEPYYSDCKTEPYLPIAENLRLFCKNILHLPKITQNNGFIPPIEITHRKYPKRVVIHPTSARPTRNWPKEKFVKLALHLKEEGYQVAFVPGDPKGWEDVIDLGFDLPVFATLDLLSRYIYESGFLIGNDSGLGHLASALTIPTLTFCRRKKWAAMWAPSFTKGIVLCPHPLIPNIRGLRLRDRYWKTFITVNMAIRAFKRLALD